MAGKRSSYNVGFLAGAVRIVTGMAAEVARDLDVPASTL